MVFFTVIPDRNDNSLFRIFDMISIWMAFFLLLALENPSIEELKQFFVQCIIGCAAVYSRIAISLQY